MFKRYTILVPAVALALGILSPFALADSSIRPEPQAEAGKAGINAENQITFEIKTKMSESLKDSSTDNSVNTDSKTDGDNKKQDESAKADKIEDVAKQDENNTGISNSTQQAVIVTTELTGQDAKIKLQEALSAEFREKAKKYGIDTTNLSDEQVREQVLTIENADAIAKARNAGINTDGLTYSQVMAAIEEWDRENARNNFGINTDGLTYSQVIAAVQERSAEMAKMKKESVNNENSSANDQLMADLIISAKALGIEYEGLSFEELYQKVIAAKAASIKNN